MPPPATATVFALCCFAGLFDGRANAVGHVGEAGAALSIQRGPWTVGDDEDRGAKGWFVAPRDLTTVVAAARAALSEQKSGPLMPWAVI